MYSKFFSLDKQDLYRGLFVAVIVVVLGALQQAVTAHGFHVMQYDWGSIASIAWKAAGAYLVKNLLSDTAGQPLGMSLGIHK